MKKYGCLLGITALIGWTIFLAVAIFLIISLRGTSLRYTIDGLVIDSPKWELRAAVASGDSGNILRAFDKATYRPVWRMNDAIPTMQGYLTNPNPLVRCYAAKALYMFGNQSGYSTLLDLVNANQPMIYFENDLRADAAETLSKYRQTVAEEAIYALYGKIDTRFKGDIIEALETLAPNRAATLIATDYYGDTPSMRVYGIVNARQFLPQITSTFQNSTKVDVKLAAAWDLATMTGDQTAIDYLAQAAQEALNGKTTSVNMRELVRYLGTIQDPRMKPLLEQALYSNDSTVAQCAIVNLLYNQGGSDKAIDVLADALYRKRMDLTVDFMLEVASQFNDNPKIRAAGESFAKTDVMGWWQLWTVERKNWPIYNWIDGYILKWNKAP